MFGKVKRQFWLLQLGWGGRLLLISGVGVANGGRIPPASDVAPEWRNGVGVGKP